MEGKGLKSVIIGVLIFGLVVEQIQVEGKSCCRNTASRNCYNICRIGDQVSRPTCAYYCDCKIITGTVCPKDYPKFNLFPNSEEAIASDYCKLGCTSSVCDAINTDVGSEEQNDAVEHCNNACSRFCTKDVKIAMATA